jgi:heme-degrading monooxygenase HmoA
MFDPARLVCIDKDLCQHHDGADAGRTSMIAVIFEVWPAEGYHGDYFEIAASLRDDLGRIDGFISVERFQSLTDPKKLLSLSFWRDEEAIRRWRQHSRHRKSQQRGRDGVFADYRLRVAAVMRDYGMTNRIEAPDDSRAFHQVKPSI